MEEIKNKLGKIAELARNGVVGEKENAIKKMQEICELYGLDFDETMREKVDTVETRAILYLKKYEERILIQTILRYGNPVGNEIWGHKAQRKILFEATESDFMEVAVAWDVLKKILSDDLEIFIRAFTHKHRLFATKESSDKVKTELTSDEDSLRMEGMMMGMKHENIQKRLNPI